jgi:hypothetical protein
LKNISYSEGIWAAMAIVSLNKEINQISLGHRVANNNSKSYNLEKNEFYIFEENPSSQI